MENKDGKENITGGNNTFDVEKYKKARKEEFEKMYLLEVETIAEREEEDEKLSQMTEEEQIEYLWQQEQEMNEYINSGNEKSLFKNTVVLTKKRS